MHTGSWKQTITEQPITARVTQSNWLQAFFDMNSINRHCRVNMDLNRPLMKTISLFYVLSEGGFLDRASLIYVKLQTFQHCFNAV